MPQKIERVVRVLDTFISNSLARLTESALSLRIIRGTLFFCLTFLAFRSFLTASEATYGVGERLRTVHAALEVNNHYRAKLRSFIDSKPDGKSTWYAERVATPLVTSGVSLDIEACTFYEATKGAHRLDAGSAVDQFTSGKFQYIQLWGSHQNRPEWISHVIEKCYRKEFSLPYYERFMKTYLSVYSYHSSPHCSREDIRRVYNH